MPYPLTTPRLRIAPLVEADIDAFVGYRQDPEVARWQGWSPAYSRTDAVDLVAGQPDSELPAADEWVQLAVRSADSSTLFGDVAVRRIPDQPETFEIGVTLARVHQRQGLAAEALQRLLDFLFDEIGAHRVIARCDSRNEPVGALLRRIGLRHESRQIEADFFKGDWTTVDGYALLDREYAANSRPTL